MNTELLPCPFCGDPDIVLETSGEACRYQCNECGAIAGSWFKGPNAIDAAAKVWNHRAPLAAVEQAQGDAVAWRFSGSASWRDWKANPPDQWVNRTRIDVAYSAQPAPQGQDALQLHHYAAIERAIKSLDAEMHRLMDARDYGAMFPEGDARALREVLAYLKSQRQT